MHTCTVGHPPRYAGMWSVVTTYDHVTFMLQSAPSKEVFYNLVV